MKSYIGSHSETTPHIIKGKGDTLVRDIQDQLAKKKEKKYAGG